MALVKFGALISEARGKEAGLVFSRNSYGGYVKQKVSPVNPQTTYQQGQRALLGGAAQMWSDLDESEKAAWKELGQQMLRVNRFGDQTYFTGFNAFVKVYRNLTLLGSVPIRKPVTIQTIPALTVTPDFDTLALNLDFTPDPLGTDLHVIIDATPPILGGRRFVKNFYRLVKATVANPTGTINIATEYAARFSALPAAGDFVGVRCRVVDGLSGWDGPPAVANAIIVTAP